LSEGKLLGTYCEDHGIYIAPIAYCRQSCCLKDISNNWTDLAKFTGHIQTWTTMNYAGPMFANDLPFHNILVEWDNNLELVDVVTGKKLKNTKFNTSFMGRLVLPSHLNEKDIFMGMPVVPKFNTKNPLGRMKDLWFEPNLPKDFDRNKVEDYKRGM